MRLRRRSAMKITAASMRDAR
jgi:hypothetical protein